MIASGERRRAALALALAATLGCSGTAELWGPEARARAEFERLEAEQRQLAQRVRQAEAHEAREREKQALSLDERLARGDRHLAAGRLGEALWEYAAAHRLAPEHAAPRVRVGYIHLRHDPERGRPLFESALDLDPDYAAAHTGLGLALLAAGERDGGLRHLERGAALAPDSAQAQAALGVALGPLGEGERGLRHLERAEELAPRDGRILNNLAVAHLRAGRPERAEALLRHALRLDRRDEPLRSNNLGLALALQGRFEEALDAFGRAGDPQAAHNNLGYAHYLRGEYGRAIAEYERALLAGGDADLEVVRNLEAARRARDGVGARPPSLPGGAVAVETPLGFPEPSAEPDPESGPQPAGVGGRS